MKINQTKYTCQTVYFVHSVEFTTFHSNVRNKSSLISFFFLNISLYTIFNNQRTLKDLPKFQFTINYYKYLSNIYLLILIFNALNVEQTRIILI